jgi:hypothetical protein
MRRAVVVHLCGQGVPENHAGFVELEAEQPAALAGRIVEAVENEIAEAVDDRLALVDFNALRDVRVAADHQRSAFVDHFAGELLLTLARFAFIFPAPMHERDDEIGPGQFGGADVGNDVIVLAPGNARPVGTRFK